MVRDFDILPDMVLAVSATDAWLEFFGRLHPALLHFPIALGVVSALVELWGSIRRRAAPSPFALTAVWFAAILAVLTAGSGWFNADYEGKSLDLNLFLHRWIGIASASLLLVLAVVGSVIRSNPKTRLAGAWRMVLLATAGALAFTGHLGGEMVYGTGYVTDALWTAIDKTERVQRESAAKEVLGELGMVPCPPAETPVPNAIVAPGLTPIAKVDFDQQIVPILKAHCYECHGNGKHKGGVYLDDFRAMTSERKGKWVVKPGDVSASLMIRNVELPLEDDEAMPPEGARVPATEVALLREWIAQGAQGPAVVSPGAVSESRWSIPERSLTSDELARIASATRSLEDLGVIVLPIADGSSNYEANASLASPPIGDEQFKNFEPLAGVLVALNLSKSAVTDAVGPAMAAFKSLRVLRIDHTAVGDAFALDISVADAMPNLDSVNFVATGLTDRGLESLAKIKTLRKLCIWSSQTSTAGVARFRAARPDVRLIDGRE